MMGAFGDHTASNLVTRSLLRSTVRKTRLSLEGMEYKGLVSLSCAHAVDWFGILGKTPLLQSRIYLLALYHSLCRLIGLYGHH